MRFKVPQNVQREDQILGPLTMKQLIIAIVGFGFAWVLWSTLNPTVATPLIVLIVVMTIAVLFVRINEMPFQQFVLEIVLFMMKPRIRVWQKGVGDITPFEYFRTSSQKEGPVEKGAAQHRPARSIEELSALLDSRGSAVRMSSSERTEEMAEEVMSDAQLLEHVMKR